MRVKGCHAQVPTKKLSTSAYCTEMLKHLGQDNWNKSADTLALQVIAKTRASCCLLDYNKPHDATLQKPLIIKKVIISNRLTLNSLVTKILLYCCIVHNSFSSHWRLISSCCVPVMSWTVVRSYVKLQLELRSHSLIPSHLGQFRHGSDLRISSHINWKITVKVSPSRGQTSMGLIDW